jgi:hypothetical protein
VGELADVVGELADAVGELADVVGEAVGVVGRGGRALYDEILAWSEATETLSAAPDALRPAQGTLALTPGALNTETKRPRLRAGLTR